MTEILALLFVFCSNPASFFSFNIFYRTTWIIDSQRFATKIKNASGSSDPSKQKWISNPSKECPKCSHVIDNSDVRVVQCYYVEVELG
jgi:hypothetical protein